MSWLFRFALIFALFVLLRSVLRRLFGLGGQPRRESTLGRQSPMRAVGSETVKDPVCGIYLEKSLSVPLDSGGSTLYFCSEECRDRFLAERVKASNE